MSPAEQRMVRQSARNGWLLSVPALVLLTFAAVGPLLIVLAYSFLTPGKYGNVEWQFSLDGWRGILYTKDIFDDLKEIAVIDWDKKEEIMRDMRRAIKRRLRMDYSIPADAIEPLVASLMELARVHLPR